MIRHISRLILLFVCATMAHASSGITVTMNTDSARAVLEALQNPTLNREASLRIAAMQGNQGIIRKLNEFKIPATTQRFADALYACAHGEKVEDATQQSFYFDTVKSKSRELLALLAQIADDSHSFQGAIEQRIAIFTPPGSDIRLQGYVVAGGDGSGYTFGDTDFYLNIGFGGEFPVAKETTTHELYHAVQGAFAKDRGDSTEVSTHAGSHSRGDCMNVAHLFENLYKEGSATYVGDISLLSDAKTKVGIRMKNDMDDGLKNVSSSALLLEMSVLSLSADNPMPYDDVYDVGFYGHGTLYDIAYVMATDIVESDGPQGLAAYLKQPAYRFVARYTQLPKYGADKDHPRLGPKTLAAANRIASGCK